MDKLTKKYISISDYDYLLMVSALVVGVSMYLLFQKYSTVTICTITKDKEIIKEISIRLETATVFKKKEEIVPKKRVIKEKKLVKKIEPIKKDIVKSKPIAMPKKEPVKVQKKIKKEIAKKLPKKTQTQKKAKKIAKEEFTKKLTQETQPKKISTPSKEIAKPVFDAKKKEEFIAGLYRVLNENKHYPKMAKRRGLEGVVYVKFTLLKDGRLVDVLLYKSSGCSILDKAALSLVASIKKYRPIPDEVSLVALDFNVPIKYSRE